MAPAPNQGDELNGQQKRLIKKDASAYIWEAGSSLVLIVLTQNVLGESLQYS